MRAGVRQLRLELLEPSARPTAIETECDPVTEDFPTLLPQPVRRFRHVLTLAVVIVAAIAAYIVVRDLIRGYWTTRGARVEHYVLHSRFVHADLHEIRVVPARHGRWTLVFLHGRGAGPSSILSQSLFDALHGLGMRAPVVLLLDGGGHSYWHDRRDGR